MSGKVKVSGKLSYVSQEPWMFMGTLRENILFGMPYQAAWYDKVIEACSLDEVAVYNGKLNSEFLSLIHI